MNHSSTTINDTSNNQNVINVSSSLQPNGMESAAKKRKFSTVEKIELQLLQAEKERWKQCAQELESENLQLIDGGNEDKIFELQDTVSKLQTMNGELQSKIEDENSRHKVEMESIVNEYSAKIKIFEDEKSQHNFNECNKEKILRMEETVKTLHSMNAEMKQENDKDKTKINLLNSKINEYASEMKILKDEKAVFECKNEELTGEIASLKSIKSEAKDSVENEREAFQTEKDKLKAEIVDLKNQNQCLLNTHKEEVKKLKEAKEASESTFVALQADTEKLSKTNKELLKNEKALQSSVDELKKALEILEANEPEKIVQLDDVFDSDSKPNPSLFSSKSKIIIEVTQLKGTKYAWILSNETNQSKTEHSLKEEDMVKSCFKMNINGELLISEGQRLNSIMHRINTCELTKLELCSQVINYADYQKLVSSKKVEICILTSLEVISHSEDSGPWWDKKHTVDELLKHLPNIKEFEYGSNENDNDCMDALSLGELEAFPYLQKFEILNLSDWFFLQDLDIFIENNNNDVKYIFEFCGDITKTEKTAIRREEKKLLKSLQDPYKIQIRIKEE